jgi:hypothetical protein
MKRIAFVTGAIGFLSIVLIFTVLGSTAAYVPDPGTNTADSSIYLPAMSKPATPRDGVPLCNSHDSTAWHPVYNPEQDCHYDHHHGRDPYDPEIVALLGSPEEYTGQAISYPWETPNENELKHRAYFWMWQVNDRCVKSGIGQQCVKAFRFQLHADMGILGFNARVHSFWGEVLACETGTDNCGIIRWGGHHDTGCGYNAYFGPLVDLPSNPDNCVVPFVNDIPYRILNHPREIAPALDKYNRGISWEQIGGSNVLWAFSDLYIDHAVSRKFVISFLDSYAAVDGDNPNNWEYFCPDFQCVFNGHSCK